MSEPEATPEGLSADAPDTSPTSPAHAGAAPSNLSEDHARLAYTIIQTLLEHTRVLSDLVALMAQVVDAETTEALTQTPHWKAYMDSRRQMEHARADLERFAEVWSKLAEEK